MAFGMKYIKGAEKERHTAMSAQAPAEEGAESSDRTPRPAPTLSQQAAPTARRDQDAGLRARRLVQEVGEFKGWTLEAIHAAERQALDDPEEIMRTYLPVYAEIKAARQKNVRTLEEAVQAHPGDVVFLAIKSGRQAIRRLTPEAAGSQRVLHGAVVESVPSTMTPFSAPASWAENKPTQPEATDPAAPRGPRP